MVDDKITIERQHKVIKSMEGLLMLYLNKDYHITGLLSQDTSFSLNIIGPFGKKELESLSKRLTLDAELMGDGTINARKTAEQILEELRKITDVEVE